MVLRSSSFLEPTINVGTDETHSEDQNKLYETEAQQDDTTHQTRREEKIEASIKANFVPHHRQKRKKGEKKRGKKKRGKNRKKGEKTKGKKGEKTKGKKRKKKEEKMKKGKKRKKRKKKEKRKKRGKRKK